MIGNHKVIEYNKLLKSRLNLDVEIEKISYVLLAIDLTTVAKNELHKELKRKTNEYKPLVYKMGHFKF